VPTGTLQARRPHHNYIRSLAECVFRAFAERGDRGAGYQ